MQEDNSYIPGPQEDTGFTNTDNQQTPDSTPVNTVLAEWTASEYIAHHKPASWYLFLGSAVAILGVGVYGLTRDVISLTVVIIAGLLFGVFAMRKPEVREYQLKPSGLVISDKHFPFESFKSFAIHEEEAIRSIYLSPIKRFTPGLTLYFPPDQEDKIVNILADYLPLEDREPDAVEKLMSKIRF